MTRPVRLMGWARIVVAGWSGPLLLGGRRGLAPPALACAPIATPRAIAHRAYPACSPGPTGSGPRILPGRMRRRIGPARTAPLALLRRRDFVQVAVRDTPARGRLAPGLRFGGALLGLVAPEEVLEEAVERDDHR